MLTVRGAKGVDATPTHDLVPVMDKDGEVTDYEPSCEPVAGKAALAKRRLRDKNTELHVNALAVKGERQTCEICGKEIKDDRMALVPVA